MKFKDLYNQIFVAERAAEPLSKEIADPADFDDVEPLPLPEPNVEADPLAEPFTGAASPAIGGGGSGTLTDYITQLEDFANKLNGTDGSSLQSLVSQLDKAESPFEGIYGRTSAEIVDAAKTLRSVSEKLKNFIIHAAKK